MLKEFTTTFHQEIHKAKQQRHLAAGRHQKRLKEVDSQIAGIIKAVTDGMYHPSLKEKLSGLEAEAK
ncbi:MAG: hypothetical protein V1721_06970 [Pseudomonadota bacterium]